MGYTTTSGRIDYVTDDLGLRGHEHFSITCHPDGSRSLRASCQMFDECLLRDVFVSVDRRFKPDHAHISLSVDGRFVGTGHYVFGDSGTQLHRSTVVGGVEHLHEPALIRPATFASHSVQHDAWMYPAVDVLRRETELVKMPRVPVSSKLSNGADGPGLILSDQTHQYVGRETLTTPAGTFSTRHYLFVLEDRPPIHYWLSGDDYLLVQCRWDYLKQTYRLVELKTI